jgi:hypothetical protein
MGLFDRLFGKKPSPIVPKPTDEDVDLQPTVAPPIVGPRELILAVDMQRAYWTPDAAALTRLEMQLARHSDPKLTMAVYGRAQLADLGDTVQRLPSLSIVFPAKAQPNVAQTSPDSGNEGG